MFSSPKFYNRLLFTFDTANLTAIQAHSPLLKSRHYFFLLFIYFFFYFFFEYSAYCHRILIIFKCILHNMLSVLVCYSWFNIINLSSTLEFTYKNAFPFHFQFSNVNCEKRQKKKKKRLRYHYFFHIPQHLLNLLT